MKRVSIAVFAAVLSACSSFPEAGTGGFAEHRATLSPNLAWDPGGWNSEAGPEPHHWWTGWRLTALHDEGWVTYQINRLDCADIHLDSLRKAGGQDHFPALIWKAERDRRRAMRGLSAGLEWDAEKEIAAYEADLSELAERLSNKTGAQKRTLSCEHSG
ncbi:hypothetical protein [Nisaea sp.]|uniref:hypothetical protein n=1 Tax=Nisaea sp. TaxID=2024842 RepID=UPI002B26CD50|nr:hypothetical protein [Nisaea sp.]